MQTRQHFSITQASIIAAFTTIVGQVIADVPSWAAYKAQVISGGSIVIAAVFVIANAIHHLAVSKAPARQEILQGAQDVVRGEVGKIDFNVLVRDAVNAKGLPDVQQEIRAEVQRVISGLFNLAPSPAPPSPPVVTPMEPFQNPPSH